MKAVKHIDRALHSSTGLVVSHPYGEHLADPGPPAGKRRQRSGAYRIAYEPTFSRLARSDGVDSIDVGAMCHGDLIL